MMKKICILLGLLFCCVPAFAQEVPETQEQTEPELPNYGPNGLLFKHPVGFVDSQTISEKLFEQTLAESGLNGVLLKIYLPDDMARQYEGSRLDGITRQVCLYGIQNSQSLHLDRRAVELMFESLKGAYANFTVVSDSVRRDLSLLEQAQTEGVRNHQNLLIETLNGDFHQAYLTLVSYRMKDDLYLSVAMCTALVFVADTAVLINCSSIVTDGSAMQHTTWVRNTAESFADMLVSANQDVQF